MNSLSPKSEKRSRFTIRSLLVVTVILALALGWLSTARDSESWQHQYFAIQQRLIITENQIKLLAGDSKRKQSDRINRFLYATNLQGANLHGAFLTIGDSAFQKTNLQDADLATVVINAGAASFQGARFDGANLTQASLSGGAASFQNTSFANALLRGAVLTGDGSSFQGASFRGADLRDATISGKSLSFQAVDIDGANFKGADLTAIKAADLDSCYFSERPSWNFKTKFPNGFKPVEARWKFEL